MTQLTFNEIKIFDDTMDDMDIIRNIITEGQKKGFYIADIGNVLRKHQDWITKLPRVIPHFGILYFSFFVHLFTTLNLNAVNFIPNLAIKANSDPTVIKVLAALNACYDCASMVNPQIFL